MEASKSKELKLNEHRKLKSIKEANDFKSLYRAKFGTAQTLLVTRLFYGVRGEGEIKVWRVRWKRTG